ncbi:hypothetical protein BC835DRAFT_1311693, partial [Cytidiella melzeri]
MQDKVARGPLSRVPGVYNFPGVVRALVAKTERLQKGKSLKGMTYGRVFTDFANCFVSLAPRAYETFRQQLGGPTTRSLRQLRAKAPRFKPGISQANVAAAKAIINKLHYHGPVSLSWDDTALELALSIYQESKDGTCLILGGATGATQVESETELERVFADTCISKADKVFPSALVQVIPTHKIFARGGKENADALFILHTQLLRLLHALDIYPISMSADGANIEQFLQRKIESSALRFVDYVIPNPLETCHLHLRIYFQDERHPFVTLQDTNHARKTGRNQLFSGARLLVM